MITHARKIDMYPASVPVIIHLSQYDDDFTIEFTLYSSVGTFTIESNTTAKIRGTKKDGNGYSASASINITQKKVTVTGNQQMTAIAGRNVYELVLTRDNKVLSTANFILDVEPAAMDANTVPSESVIQEIGEAVTAYLDEHDIVIDPTLTQSGKAADAKKTGDEIADLKSDISKIEPGLSDEAKAALLACFENVVWKNTNGSQLYDMLESALYAEDYPRITAIFNSGTNKIYTDDTLETLKQYLTVTYYEAEGSAGVAVPSNEYVLTGTLTEGTNTVVVTYQRYTTAFNVMAIDFYNIWTRKLSDGTLTKLHASVDTNQSNTSMYPSRVCILDPYDVRRHICVERGKAPYYYKNQTNVASPYYPIPIPFGANHVKITMKPLGQYAYVHFVPYDAETNTYGNSTADTRIPWGQFDANGLEMTLDGTKQWYMVMNTKYDSAGSSYPVEPTEITVEFSEV